MTINITQAPYFEDYDVNNSYYKILFKPGVAVQARELTQIQSIIQKQIETFGKSTFKEGSMVIPGNTSIDTNVGYVKLQGTSDLTPYLNQIITGVSSGITATVLKISNVENNDPRTLYVKYNSSGTDTIKKTFADNEVINDSSNVSIGSTATTNATGLSAIASIQTGFYFIKNLFVQVVAQSILLDKYSNIPSYKIGLDAIESIATSDSDESLLDASQGSPNFAAPGADRYKVELNLVKKVLDDSSNDANFIQLIVVKSGIISHKVVNTDYSILENTLARRTFDESGDYTVRNFPIDVREYRNNLRGAWVALTPYLAGDIVSNGGNFYRARLDGTSNSTAPSQVVGSTTIATTGLVWTLEKAPYFNRGINDVVNSDSLITQNINKAKLAIGLEPGKAYVKGYEIEKISTEYIAINKARDFNQLTNVRIPATVGNYVLATNINSLPNILTFPLVNLYNQFTTTAGVSAGTLVGTARIKYVEFNADNTQGTQTTKYKLALFAVTMNSGFNFNTDVKQFFIAGGSSATSFSADVFPILSQMTGAITASASTTVSGIGTLFLSELRVGDYVIANNIRRRITTIASNTSLTVDSVVTLSGELFYAVYTLLNEPKNNPLIYPLSYPYIKSVRDGSGANNTAYSASTQYTQTSVVTGSTSTLTLASSGTDTFASSADPDNYLVLDNVTGLIVVPTSIVYGSSTQQVIITLSSGVSKQYVAIVALNKVGSSTEKSKTLTTITSTFTPQSIVTSSVISLNKADGFRLLQVSMDTGSFASPTGIYTNDITSRYSLNDGQLPSHYNLCSITLNQNEVTPIAPIQVTFEYFEHSGTGDYFTVNSYLSSISYDEIPLYNNISLAYAFDFRPRISDNGTTFSGTTLLPKRGIDIQADFQYYLSRNDKIALNQTGAFFAVSGISDISPSEPSDPSTGMVVYKLSLRPYSYSTSSLDVRTIDNKRYTMRDIGKLEKRIDNIEYYTSLSMLEQETQSLEIQDQFGFNRFKNGFIVDNFTGHNIGDVSSIDYKCAIDMEQGQLRPLYSMDNVNLIEANISDTQRATNGYQVTGDLVTLPYTESNLVSQLNASRVENLNPFAIFTFIGNADLNPPSDEWFETKRLPDIITNVEGNFNAMYAIASASGALSPVWNAWQTQWTGAPISTGVKSAFIELQSNTNIAVAELLKLSYTDSPHGRAAGRRNISYETSATTLGQSRTGVRTVVVPKVTTQVTNDRILSSAVIPYIRARKLLFVVRGLKPNTKFTPFFDSINVSAFSTPSTQLIINKNAVFSSSVRAGGDSAESARFVNGSSESALDRGDVVFVKQRGATIYTKFTSPATGILSLVTDIANSTTSSLSIVNVIGSFLVGDIVGGSITTATSTITATPITNTIGQTLTSNANGDVVGIFAIPNTESNRFRTGVREFKLSDDLTDSPSRTSFARKQYRAEGIIETKQASVTATRNADLRQESVVDTRTVVQQSARIISDSGWYDPIAQTFLVQSKGGAFITSIDIFFATKDINIPVRMQIREVVNGYPGKVIIPFSEKVLTPNQVNISSTLVQTTQGEIFPSPTLPTNFKFDSPVYLNDATEYCIVLLSDSNNYKAWIAQLGEKSVVSGAIISEQPYAGVLFKSQNASTWTADQYQDLMFNINKAKFTLNQFGEVDFVNTSIPLVSLQENPIYTVTGTNYVRISHNNHGFFAGSIVTLSGITNAGGIPVAQLNTTLTILSVEFDSYVVQVTGNATFTGNFGGTVVLTTNNIAYTTIQPIVQQQSFSDTSISHFIRTTSSKSINGSESPYILSSLFPIEVNQNNKLTNLQLVGNTSTETTFNGSNKSVKLHSRFITSNENISPVIDIARLSLILVQDRVNTPTDANTNVVQLDTRNIVTSNSLVSITNSNTFTTSDAPTMALFLSVNIGRFITTTGFANALNNGKFLVTAVAIDGSSITTNGSLVNVSAGASITLNSLDRYVDEIAPTGSSSVSKYISKKINLQNPSSFLKVKFAADVSQLANIDLYYKLKPVGVNPDFATIAYTKATPILSAVKSNNLQFSDVQYDIPNLSVYDAVQIKLVINATNSSNIVRVKDLSIICCV